MASMVVNPLRIGLTQFSGRQTGAGATYRDRAGVSVMLPEPDSKSSATEPMAEVRPPVTPRPRTEVRGQATPPVAPEVLEARQAAVLAEHQRMADLAYSCLLGDPYAWEALVRSQQRRVYALCYRFTNSPTAAEDLTQDVFLKVYRNLQSFDSAKASFGVWLTTLTRNLLVDHYRRSRMDRASESLDESVNGDDEGPSRAERLADTRAGQERHVAGMELRAKIQAALALVSPELREAVILRDLEDMDYRDIAETLCIPQGTVKSRISRGRAELARHLKGLEGQVM